jgi:3-hydroxymyristoyl/3-hydroxydecanoyl-(acyl carrier protein) dehydratase
MVLERVVTIDPGHPALPGHFPGHPVVPGVLILGEVINAIQAGSPNTIVGIPRVKFLSTLRPGEPLCIRIEPAEKGRVAFTCMAGIRRVAAGVMEIGPSARAGEYGP